EDEPREIVCNYVEHNLEVSVPVFSFGYKEACEEPLPSFRKYIEMSILLEVIAGKTSPFYTKLFESGLINSSFSKEYFTGYGYEAVIFDGESENPEAVATAIKEEIARIKKEGIDPELFESVRRTLYGKEIMSFNDIDNIANSLITCDFNNWDIFEAVNIYRDIKVSDIEKRLSSMMDEQYSALSVVKKSI
ncbi:MAG: insulinase family protein, partial [Eubacterium sp.]|nr:insulinase family protein [Eubacterium sp.]